MSSHVLLTSLDRFSCFIMFGLDSATGKQLSPATIFNVFFLATLEYLEC